MTSKILPKVFGWMFIGLLVTFFTGYYVSLHPETMLKLFGSYAFLIVIIIEFAIVIFLSARITKMKPATAIVSFLIYSAVSGLTFSIIFVTYDLSSIMYVFLLAAGIFAVFAFLGAVTKIDLSKLGVYLFIGLFAIIICGLINLFLNNSTFDMIVSCIAIAIFVGYTAYDVQQILRMQEFNMLPEDNLAIYGALELYLDFINLFLRLLQLFGSSHSDD